jgi:hypothetical protein
MKKNINRIDFEFFLSQFERTEDPKWAIDIVQMISDKKISLRFREEIDPTQLKFIPNSNYANKCIICNERYEKGSSCFIRNSQGWHEACATEQDKELPYYQGVLRKRAIISNADAKDEKEFMEKVFPDDENEERYK